MDYVESATFVVEDEKWIEKIGLGALASILSVIIVGALALAGWSMEAFRRVVSGDSEKLPGWTAWQTYLTDGVKLAGVAIIWYIPVILLSLIWRYLGLIASIPYAFLLVGAFIILVRTGEFTRALNPVNAWNLLSPNLNAWIVVVLIAWAASVVVGWVISLLTGAGLILSTLGVLLSLVTSPWLTVAVGHLIGTAYVEIGAEV